MMNFKNEEAVSPVIGVILMVAITVILAAVIAAFVFGMTGNVQSTKNVAVTATQTGENVTIVFQGGADANSVTWLNWTVDENETQSGAEEKPKVGETNSTKIANPGKANHVVVVASFLDGSSQVVLDTHV
ncbi:type IV pilin [Methanoculleus sp. MH98A]|uniref:type IV pilin n=1 Tax=Methanoculleus sp. MH98A TaxID=1495314 RepID=UPI0009E30A9E|nr:type IV pilin N-terminal domain-containing protein [Methanoculleus sp. MH98A]